METKDSTQAFAQQAGRSAIVAGVLGLVSLVAVIAGEVSLGMDGFAESGLAIAAGWSAFAASALLVVGLLGLGVRYVDLLSAAGRTALLVLTLATAVTVGATSTMALVVPAAAQRAPDLVANPPMVVPPTFIFSGLVMGICGLVIVTGMRRAGLLSRGGTWLLTTGSVLAMLPLPSRFFLLAFAVGVVVLAPVAARASDRALGTGAAVRDRDATHAPVPS